MSEPKKFTYCLIDGRICGQCGYAYGKTNLSYGGCDVYFMCKCEVPKTDDTLYLLDTQNIEWLEEERKHAKPS